MIGLLLFIIAIVLGSVLLPLGFAYMFINLLFTLSLKTCIKRYNDYLFAISYMIDLLANVVCSELFNDILIKKWSKYKFGEIRQTISYVLGKNLIECTLTKYGKWLQQALDMIEENHCIKSVEKYENIKIL